MSIIEGKVIEGKKIGRTLGFPTLNLPYNGKKEGVFVGKVFLNKKHYAAAVHIGKRLTLNDLEPVCEAFLLNFNGNVKVGTPIKVEIIKKIRNTKKFADLSELKMQIAKDVDFVKTWYT